MTSGQRLGPAASAVCQDIKQQPVQQRAFLSCSKLVFLC